MILSDELKNQFQNSLRREKNSFYDETMSLFNDSLINPVYYPFVFGRLSRNYPAMFNEEYALNIINGSFDIKDNPSINRWLIFELANIEEFFNSKTQQLFNLKYDLILKDALANFSINSDLLKRFKMFFDCHLFLDLTLEDAEAQSYLFKHRGQVFDIEGWAECVKGLIEGCYNDFEFDKAKSTRKIYRFTKKLNETTLLALQYDNQELKFQLKNNNLSLPEISLVVLNNDFKKTAKYSNLGDGFIWYLGSHKNPFFALQSSLSGYYARSTSDDRIEEPFSRLSIAQVERVEVDKVRLYNDISFAESLKKFAFYETLTSSIYNKSYIRYIEKSFLNINF